MSNEENEEEARDKRKLPDKKIERMYDMFEDGATYDKIKEELGINSDNTVAKYKKLWKEEKEIEEQVQQKELSPKKFERLINKIPGVGKKKRKLAKRLVEIDPTILEDPNKIFYMLVNQIGLKQSIADTVVNGILSKYMGGDEDGVLPSKYQSGESKQQPQPRERYNPRNKTNSQGSKALPNYEPPQQRHSGEKQNVPNNQSPVENRSPDRGGGRDYVVRYIPVVDNNGDYKYDKHGNIVKEKVEIPPEQANRLQGNEPQPKGQQEQMTPTDMLEMMRTAKEMFSSDNEEKEDDKMAQILQEMNRQNNKQQKQMMQVLRGLKSDGEKKRSKNQSEDKVTTEDLEDFKKDIVRIQEEKKRNELLTELKEERDELLGELDKRQKDSLSDEAQEREHEKEMTELTMNESKEIGKEVREGLESGFDRVVSLFEKAQKKGDMDKQQGIYEKLVENLMRHEGFDQEVAMEKAEELLSESPTPTQEATQVSSFEELSQEIKRRAEERE